MCAQTIRDVMPILQLLQLLCGRLEDVRREAAAAEERAQQLAAEVRGATEALNARTDAYNKAVGDFFRCAPASVLVAACLCLLAYRSTLLPYEINRYCMHGWKLSQHAWALSRAWQLNPEAS